MDELDIIGRKFALFGADIARLDEDIRRIVKDSRFLVIGGGGSIGRAVAIEIFKRDPKKLHVVDISENNLVELVRDLRSSIGYGAGDFKTFAVDCLSLEFEAAISVNGPYDYVFNLSALKHVRSEKDPFTLMRMVMLNVFGTIHTMELAQAMGANKYFCVSTDKAANPVNMMGASKRIMELFVSNESSKIKTSMARFANVAFSDGSLLHGFNQRFIKGQPISAPKDIKRYFLTSSESGELCLLSGLYGDGNEIFFPKLTEDLHLVTFSDIAKRYITAKGYSPHICESEEEARAEGGALMLRGLWPCYFFDSDTTGEKAYEEFYTLEETLNVERYNSIGVVENTNVCDPNLLRAFHDGIFNLRDRGVWTKAEMLEMFSILLPDFDHKEMGRHLDQRM